MSDQKVNLYEVIHADRLGPAPLALRVVITPQADHMVGGVPQAAQRGETYVLLSILPDDIRRRVELAVQMQIASV